MQTSSSFEEGRTTFWILHQVNSGLADKRPKQIINVKIISVFLLGFVLCIMMGMAEAYGLQYTDEEQGFSIDHPTGWGIENTFFSESGVDYLVTFYDDLSGWNSMLEIRHAPNISLVQAGTDEQWLNALNVGLEQNCELLTLEVYGSICANHELIDSRVIYIDGKKSYQHTYSWTETLTDSTQYENVSINTIIPDGFGYWNIYSESTTDVFLPYREQIVSSVSSFDVLKTAVESGVPTRDNRIIFEEGINTFIDLGTRPMSLVTPVKFSPEWYVNSNHGFAIKFPHSWEENWNVNESFSGKKFAEFSSKSTDGKLEFFIEDQNLFRIFNGFEKDRIYEETEKMVTESISRFSGFFHVDSLGVAKFKDGFFTSATFFQLDEAGQPVQYDLSYLIFDDGKIIEIAYYGDNYSAISLNDYGLMLDSSYLGDTSLIPTSEEMTADSEVFVDYDLGFSFIPPKQWIQEGLNTQIEPASVPISLSAVTAFIPSNFQGFVPPTVILLYANFERSINLDDQNERKQFLEDFSDGLTSDLGENIEVEVINSDVEFFDNVAKVGLDASMRLDMDGQYMERQLDIVGWMFENGEIYYLIYSADPVDFPTYHDEFKNSINTVTFDEKLAVQQTEIDPSDEKPTSQETESGGGCLIATATYGSELALQVQQLRELRDSKLLQTESGTAFMNTFNDIYYSFSPIIADYERENPLFRGAVKIAITPMISSLSLLNYVDMDSEHKVLRYGISLILLNLGIYIGIPVSIIVGIRCRLCGCDGL